MVNTNSPMIGAYDDKETILQTDTTKMLIVEQNAYNTAVTRTKLYVGALIILFFTILWQLLYLNTK